MDEKKKQVVENDFAANRKRAKELEDQTREELNRKRKEKEFIDLELSTELREAKYKKILALSQEKEQKERFGILKSAKNKLLDISRKGVKAVKDNSTKLLTGASLLAVLGTGWFVANGQKQKTIEEGLNQQEQEQRNDSNTSTSQNIDIEAKQDGVTVEVNKKADVNKVKESKAINNPGNVRNPDDVMEVTKESNGDVTEAKTETTKVAETEEERTTENITIDQNGNKVTKEEKEKIQNDIKKVEEQKEQAVKEVKEQGGTIKEVDVLDKNGNSTGEKITAVTKTNDEQKTKDTKQDEKKGQPAYNVQQKEASVLKSEENVKTTPTATPTPAQTQKEQKVDKGVADEILDIFNKNKSDEDKLVFDDDFDFLLSNSKKDTNQVKADINIDDDLAR